MMTRAQLEHLLRAAGDLCEEDEFIVIGSQAILGQFPDAPAALRVSAEADLIPCRHPQRADLIDGTIGELSPFHDTYGYYAQGVDETTATLPAGWRERVVTIQNENTRGITGRCLEVHDLLVSKLVAARDKDHRFARAAIAHGLVDAATLLNRLAVTAIPPPRRDEIAARVRSYFHAAPWPRPRRGATGRGRSAESAAPCGAPSSAPDRG